MSYTMRLFLVMILVSLMITTSVSSSPQLSGLTLNLTTLTTNRVLVVNISLGTPAVELELIMDTGSSLTWTLCQPPHYDPQASKSYRKLPCSDPLCTNYADSKKYNCSENQCVFDIKYGDETEIKGVASSETLTFLNGASSVTGVMFGCSETEDGPSGIMGFSPTPDSIIFQLLPPEKRIFSYCVSPFTDGHSSSTTLMTLGDDVNPTKTPSLQTPFVIGVRHYNLYLLDISVGNCRLGLPAGTFAPSGPEGMVIDSGTTYTSLYEKPYSEVIGAFEQHFSALGLQKTSPQGVSFKLCYWKPAGFNDFPTMTYHFQGADYVVDGKYTSDIDEKGGHFCVALIKRTQVLLGAWHQQNMRLVHDVSKGVLAFGPEDCAADHSP